MDKQKILDAIFSNDPFGLLNVKASSKAKTDDDRLHSSFEEINQFYDQYKREPQQVNDINERSLYSRLQGIRSNPQKIEELKELDKYKLLEIPLSEEIETIDDIFSADPFGILGGNDEGLFDFKNVPNKEEMEKRAATDFVAKRKPCKDFDKYEPLFKKVQNDLKTGKRKLVKFNEQNMQEKTFYVHNGILVYLEKIFEITKDKNSKFDGRIYCIFENGTESNMLYRSLGKALYENGSAVTHNSETDELELFKNAQMITDEDSTSGFIYVLSSKSLDPKISEINNLYKIGYSTTPVEERIKNAEMQPTYLMAPVKVEAVYQTYNTNTQKFEQLLHNFFGSACVNIDVFDKKSKRHMPQEWFVAPLIIIDRAVELILQGEIVKYIYDRRNEVIKERDS
jgi:hypothetical protein